MNTNKHKLKRKQIRDGLIFTRHRMSRRSHRETGHPDFGILMIRVNSCAFVVDFLQNQHAIAIAVKAIAFANC
ncbi:MAG: hypothetical protein WBX14_11980, partial [Candidatus Udaeobacter sp.]